MGKDADTEMLKRAAENLGEFFDSVQIFATRHEEGEHGGTVRVQCGVGNWYARFGHVCEWKLRQDEAARQEARPEAE